MNRLARLEHYRSGTGLALILLLCGCAANQPPRARPFAPSATSAQQTLPPDLDVLAWLDLARLRGLWSQASAQQLANILSEYGLFAAPKSGKNDADSDFWVRLLAQSDRWWLACRPTNHGCLDTVVFARGHFDQQRPLEAMLNLGHPLDLGGGWYRYDRLPRSARQHIARVYVAPPDRYVVVSDAELDAVERRLEQGLADDSTAIDERGLLSVRLRPDALARLVESRSPASARFLRSATAIRFWLELLETELLVTVVVSFDHHQRAEIARSALALVASKWLESQASTADGHTSSNVVTTEALGNDVTIRWRIKAPEVSRTP